LPELPEETFWIMKYNFNCFILLLFKKLKLTFQKIKIFEIFRFIYLFYLYWRKICLCLWLCGPICKQTITESQASTDYLSCWNPRNYEKWKS
jgi:hypothetical protein